MDHWEFNVSLSGLATSARRHDLAGSGANWATVRTIRTNVLEIGYHESGDPAGFPVILLHGFPDDAHAYDEVAPILIRAGCRVFAVYLRGFGPTRFLEPRAPRTAQQAAIGQDVIDFADAVGVQRFGVCGFDWGSRAACIAAFLHPERVRATVLTDGYPIQNTVTPGPPATPEAVRLSWYQWYFNTERGREGLQLNRHALCKLMWRTWSPTWNFTDSMFDLAAQSFENIDFVDCVVHSYRHRHFNAPGEPRFIEVERRLAERPKVHVPTIVLRGRDSGFGGPAPEAVAAEGRLFPRLVDRRFIKGVGHFVPHEKPEVAAKAVLDVLDAST